MSEDVVKEGAEIISGLLEEFSEEIENLPTVMEHKKREEFLEKIERANNYAKNHGGTAINITKQEKVAEHKRKFREWYNDR